jgi:ABC-type microcin C transport system permease subunit YejE
MTMLRLIAFALFAAALAPVSAGAQTYPSKAVKIIVPFGAGGPADVYARVVAQHLLPNVFAPYLIILTAQLGTAILAEAALSYLGLGAAEPTPSWGLMLSGSAPSYAEKAPWIGLFPGIAISLAVFGFSLFGDSLRDALDPKLRGK